MGETRTYALRYRCRQCELCYDARVPIDPPLLESGAIRLVRSAVDLLEVHPCADGSFGVADFVGAVPVKKESGDG